MTRKQLRAVLEDAEVWKDPITSDVAICLPTEVVGLLLARHGSRRHIPGGYVVQFDHAEAIGFAVTSITTGDWRQQDVAKRLLSDVEWCECVANQAAALQRAAIDTAIV